MQISNKAYTIKIMYLALLQSFEMKACLGHSLQSKSQKSWPQSQSESVFFPDIATYYLKFINSVLKEISFKEGNIAWSTRLIILHFFQVRLIKK